MPTNLPLWTLCYAAGIWAGAVLGVGAALAWAGLGLLLLYGAVVLRWPARHAAGARRIALLAALCLGVLAQDGARRPVPVLAQLAGPTPRDEVPLRFEAQVRGAVTQTRTSAGDASGAADTAGAVRLRLWRVQPTPGGPWQAIAPPLSVLAQWRGPLRAPLWPGDAVQVRGRLRPARGLRNPGPEDPVRHAAAAGIDAVLSLEADALLRRADVPPAIWLWPLRAAAQARAHLLRRIEVALRDVDPALRGLIAALCLGDRAALGLGQRAQPPVDLEAVFRDAGVYHVLSVSGLHLAVATWLLFQGLQALLLLGPGLGAARPIAALVTLPAVGFYTLLTGAEVATVRAAVAAGCWLLGLVLGRRGGLGEALGAAGLVLLLASPLQLFEPAFQLSIAATWGAARLRPLASLLGSAPALEQEVAERLPRLHPVHLGRGALRLLDATLGATLATTPLCALHFSAVQGAGLFGNLLVVPPCEGLVLPLGLLGAAAGLLWPALGSAALHAAAAAARVALELARELAGWGLSAAVPSPGAAALLLWAVGLVLLAYTRGAPMPSRVWLGPGALAALLWLGPDVGAASALRVTLLDVGQGDATVVELPGGQVLVIDGGNGPGPDGAGPDLGQRVVAPFLQRRGLRRIDVLVASHPHPDHVGGLAALVQRFPVGEIWTADGPALEAADPTWARVLAEAAARAVPVRAPRTLSAGGATVEVLWPGAAGAARRDPELSHNDNSLVLRVRYAGRAVLLPGDIERDGEAGLLAAPGGPDAVRADVLKVPHHCSRTSSTEALLRAVAPQVAVCSLGYRNRYGFPHAEVVARYERAGIRLLRTDQDGAVQVRITRHGELSVQTTRDERDDHSPL